MHFAWHWIAWTWGGDHTGGASGTGYLISSGPEPHFERWAIAFLLIRHLNCHEPGCWRMAHHHRDGYCRKHHQKI